VVPDPKRLIEERVDKDYIVLTQRPTYQAEAGWQNESERPAYIKSNKLSFLRPYQLSAVHSVQSAIKARKDRFLFEMATGTGKTLTAAAIIKLFLRSGNAHRVLFLVDRLELEDQAKKAFAAVLAPDYKTVIFKENRDDWRHADIVVSTVQSFLFNNKYQNLFSPTDFDFVISDEAHRSIGGNARAVFDYFIGYKLGLTATPRDYLRSSTHRSPHQRTLANTSAVSSWTHTEPSAAKTASQPFAIRCSTASAMDTSSIRRSWMPATDVTTQLLSEQGLRRHGERR
jgi:type I restriction enzyme R subunit